MTMQEKAKYLLDCYASRTPVDGGVYLQNLLDLMQLDFTEASLARIDQYLQMARSRHKESIDTFFTDNKKENFALTLTFYLGEYISRTTNTSIDWHSHADLDERLQSTEPAPKLFNNYAAAFTDNLMLLPLLVLEHGFFGVGEATTAQGFVSDAIEKVEQQALTRGNEWRPEYLDWFLAGKKVPGGFNYLAVLKHINLDFSMGSLERIDSALKTICVQNRPQHATFFRRIGSANFIWLLATYWARTTAQRAQCSLKWLDQAGVIEAEPTLSKTFETTLGCRIDKGLVLPIAVIAAILFDLNNEASVKKLANTILAAKPEKLVFLKRGMTASKVENGGILSKIFSGPKMVWQEQIRKAGFFAAHSAFMVAGGGTLAPAILQPKGRENLIVDFTFYGDDPMSRALQVLSTNPEKAPYQVLAYEGWANFPEGRKDGIVVTLQCYEGPKLSLTALLPFSPAENEAGFKVHTPVLVETSTDKKLNADIAQGFYEGVDSNPAFKWQEHFA